MRAHLNAAVHHGLRQSFWFHLCWIDSVEWFRVRSGKILSVILDHVANQLFKLLKCVFASHICGLRTFHQEVQCHIRCKQSSYTWAKKCHITPQKKLYYCPANLSHLCAISWVKCLLIFEPFIDFFESGQVQASVWKFQSICSEKTMWDLQKAWRTIAHEHFKS